jgi:hypothetical protein
MKPKIILCLALALFMGLALQRGFCSQEAILEPVEASIRADAGAPFGEVSATLRTKGRNLERRISDIKLRVGRKSIRIPEKAYSDLTLPLLNTIELRREPGYDKEPWLYIFFQVGFHTSDGQWRPKRVRIAYHAGRIESRSIETPNPDGSATWKEDKL